MSSETRLALVVPRWAVGFYRRHWRLIAGLSLVPGVQRLIILNWDVPAAFAIPAEVLVMGIRVLLLVLIWRLATRGMTLSGANAGPFVRAHWPSLLIQGVMFVAAFLVLELVVERAVGSLFPEHARDTYLALLYFVKNPTVIAFTSVLVVGWTRQLLADPADAPAGRAL